MAQSGTLFRTLVDELNNAATYTTNTNGQIQGQVQSVLTFINSLRDSGYTGSCASQLSAVADQWYTDAQNLNNVLTEIAGNLRTNANNYAGGESTNTTNVTAVGATLPGGSF